MCLSIIIKLLRWGDFPTGRRNFLFALSTPGTTESMWRLMTNWLLTALGEDYSPQDVTLFSLLILQFAFESRRMVFYQPLPLVSSVHFFFLLKIGNFTQEDTVPCFTLCSVSWKYPHPSTRTSSSLTTHSLAFSTNSFLE